MQLSRALAAIGVGLALAGAALAGEQEPQSARAIRRTPLVEVIERVRDSIVNISATGLVNIERSEIFDLFFDMPHRRRHLPRQREVESVGSGFVMHESGYIVTNAHVVDRSIDLRVTFADGKEYKAAVVVSDVDHDLAILKIKADRPLKPIPMGRSDDLMIGESTVAIGNPLGYANTVTSGIISALHRKLEFSSDVVYDDLIQTDASINPGSSGGPLLNILGELIGVNTAIRAGAENIGFAIPVDKLRTLLPDMLDAVMVEERHFELGMRVEGNERPRVVEVEADSAADEAGVRVGDEVVRVGGRSVDRDVDFYIAMLGRSVGDSVPTELLRNGKKREVSLTLTEIPKPDGTALALAKFGMTIEPLAPRAAQHFGVPQDAGVLIMEVQRRSPADRAGCRPGDLLVRIGLHRITSPDDLGALLKNAAPDTPADLGLWRVIRGDVYEIYPPVRIYAR
ncbi:MAG: PDZ domain-containing protein [bacterium]|nr:PDZ domain-containing protein [bacterium]